MELLDLASQSMLYNFVGLQLITSMMALETFYFQMHMSQACIAPYFMKKKGMTSIKLSIHISDS